MTWLQVTWFLLVGVLLTGFAILDGFDLGVGFWHLKSKGDKERRTLLNAVGPVWDGNEVWLLTGGGALFAAFPPVYASVFSGFYLAMMLLLFALILRAVSLEFRSKEDSPGGAPPGMLSFHCPVLWRGFCSVWPWEIFSGGFPSAMLGIIRELFWVC